MQKDRRSFFRFVVEPQKQLKIGLLFMGLCLVGTTLLVAALIFHIDSQLTFLAAEKLMNEEAMLGVRDSLQSTLLYVLALTFALAVLAGIFSVRLSHRIYGPLVPILQHIKALGDGNYTSRVRLRRGDEFKELQDALNELAGQLERSAPKT